MRSYAAIGQPFPVEGAREKAIGEARFTDDIFLPGMLYGRILRSPDSHARILHIDTHQAQRLAGVKAVITGRDTPRIPYGLAPNVIADRYPLAVDRVRFVGEEVAAVAAVDEATAEEALKLIHVEYGELPSVFDPEEAMQPGAPPIHEAENNICGSVSYRIGDVEAAFNQSYYTRQDRFFVPSITHGAIEPHSAVASVDPFGNLTIWTSSQTLPWVRTVLARTLGISEDRVRAIAPFVGGAFGGKSGLFAHEICAALLSRATGSPVKITCTREEVLSASLRRHAMIIHLETGVDRDGVIQAMRCKVVAESGAYANMGAASISYAAAFLTLPYRVPHVEYEGYRVFTNRPVCGPQRGPGTPQIRFAVESQLDKIARELKIDPVDIRRRNAAPANETTSTQLKVTSNGLIACIQSVAEKMTGPEKERLSGGHGVGIACSAFMSGYNLPPYVPCPAAIKVEEDGTATAYTATADFGQGEGIAVRQIVAEELGLEMESVKARSGDTTVVPDRWWSFCDTFATGRALQMAAAEVRRQLLPVVAERLEASIDDLDMREGKIFVKGSPDKGMSFARAAQIYQRRNKRPLTGEGQYCANTDMLHIGKRNLSATYSFSAQGAEVEVDKETGQVGVRRMVNAYDCGFALNPLVVAGTLQGGSAMGIGQALMEEILWEGGQALNSNFLDYRLPTALDTPPIDPVIVESMDPQGPFGAKEVGQGSVQAAAPAVANAICQALDIGVSGLPLTPEKLLSTLDEKEKISGS